MKNGVRRREWGNKALFLQDTGITRWLSVGRLGFVWSKGCSQGCGNGGDRETGECQVLDGRLGASHRESALYPGPVLPAADLLPWRAPGSCDVHDATKGEGTRICGSDSGERKNGHHSGATGEGRGPACS